MSTRRRDSLLAGALLLVLTGATGGWVLADQPASVTQAGGATAGVQGTAPPPNVPVMVQAPNPTHQTRPAELQVISKEVLDQLLGQQDASIMWFGGLATFIVFVLSVLIRWDHHKLEKTRDKELDQKFDTLIKEKLDTEVENQVKTLFKDRYEERIAQLTKALTQEVLMTTPDAQNKLVSILRRTVNELSSIIIRLPDEGAATELHQLLAHAIEDWYALGQLYSPDREQLETGLLAVRTRPIPEASDRLRRLQQRYQSDLDLLPGIVAAIEAVEQQAAQSERA